MHTLYTYSRTIRKKEPPSPLIYNITDDTEFVYENEIKKRSANIQPSVFFCISRKLHCTRTRVVILLGYKIIHKRLSKISDAAYATKP